MTNARQDINLTPDKVLNSLV